MTRAALRPWILRCLVGAALGFAMHIFWEKHPAARLATRLLGHAAGTIAAPSPVGKKAAQSDKEMFSLDAIAASPDPAGEMRRWREKVERMSPDRRADFLNAAVQVSSAGLRSFLAALAHDAELREETHRWIDSVASFVDKGGDALMRRTMMQLAQMDLALALDAAEALDSPTALTAVLMVMAETDPAGALRIANERHLPMEQAGKFFEFAILIEGLRDQAAGEARLLDPTMPASVVANAGARLLAALPPEKAIAACRDITGTVNWEVLSAVLDSLPASKAGGFLAALVKEDPESMAVRELAPRFAARMAQHDPDAATAWLESSTAERKWPATRELIDILRTAAAREPKSALELAGRCPSEEARAKAKQAVFATWFQTEPEAALSALTAHPDAASSAGSGNFIATLWFAVVSTSTDFHEAMNRIDSLGAGKPASKLQSLAASHWAATDPKAAMEWAQATGNPDVAGYAFRALNQNDPDAAIQVATTLPPAGRAAIATLLGDISLSGAQRIALLQSIPPESLPKPERVAQALGEADDTSLFDVKTWLQHQPTPFRAETLHYLLKKQLSQGRAEAAAALLPAIDDPAERFAWERVVYQSTLGKERAR